MKASRNAYKSIIHNWIFSFIKHVSLYSQEDLATALQAIKAKIEDAQTELARIEKDAVERKAMMDTVIPAYKQFRSWSVEFYESSLEVKKMIASQLFSRITVNRDYELTIELNFTYRQFLEDWLAQTPDIKEPAWVVAGFGWTLERSF